MIGVPISKSAVRKMVVEEANVRASAIKYLSGACYNIHPKNHLIEETLLRWLQDQRAKCVLVNGRMVKGACMALVDILDDSDDTGSDAKPSFSASWFNTFKSHHQISYCQLQGEAGSVNMDAIEPELVNIRANTESG
ncbi:hypothetical protein BGZ54_008116 [Gamsiella multidivaricata]|nr:hypothetical protein BGZ54_008116 [Gamsiella multidivaricata]